MCQFENHDQKRKTKAILKLNAEETYQPSTRSLKKEGQQPHLQNNWSGTVSKIPSPPLHSSVL